MYVFVACSGYLSSNTGARTPYLSTLLSGAPGQLFRFYSLLQLFIVLICMIAYY